MSDTPNKDNHSQDELWTFIDEANEEQARMEARKAAAKAASETVPEDPSLSEKPESSPPPPPPGPKGGGFVRAGFYLSLVFVVIFTSMTVYDYYKEYRDEKILDGLKGSSSEVVESIPAKPGEKVIFPQFAEAYARNSDMVGWIEIEDTVVDFPVMQGRDNSYYLTTNFDLQTSKYGTPFVDYRIDLSNQPGEQPDNLIIYGHNMGDGKMFYDFIRYSDPDYYKDHPIIQVSSLYDTRHYKVFSAFIANGETKNGYIFPYHMFLSFTSPAQYDGFIAELKDRSIINVDTDLSYGDKLLCISTCTYEFDGARYVVFARELREGESMSSDPVERNPDPLYPLAFTRLYGGRSDS